MTRNNNDRPTDNRRRHNPRNNNNNRNHNRNQPRGKKYSKSMILLKSTVFALFVVLVTLITAFIIFKNNKDITSSFSNEKECQNNKIKLTSEVDEIAANDSGVYIVTKNEIIKLDNKCLEEERRVTISK